MLVIPLQMGKTDSEIMNKGGEIRDEAAIGCGSRSKAGLCGFAVSDLLIPKMLQPWELDVR